MALPMKNEITFLKFQIFIGLLNEFNWLARKIDEKTNEMLGPYLLISSFSFIAHILLRLLLNCDQLAIIYSVHAQKIVWYPTVSIFIETRRCFY